MNREPMRRDAEAVGEETPFDREMRRQLEEDLTPEPDCFDEAETAEPIAEDMEVEDER